MLIQHECPLPTCYVRTHSSRVLMFVDHISTLYLQNSTINQCLFFLALFSIAKFEKQSEQVILIRHKFNENLEQIQATIRDAGDVLGRKLWNEFIGNYAKTMNERILSLMEE